MFFKKHNKSSFNFFFAVTLGLSFVTNSNQVQAQPSDMDNDKCEYFKEVTTDGTEIRKKIQDTLIRRNNWNTDFAVPTGEKYDFFVGKMLPENTDNYEVSIHLKYPNGTSDTVYSRNIELERGESYSLTFQTPTSNQPYQVNVRVGGSNNNAYTISVLGCQ